MLQEIINLLAHLILFFYYLNFFKDSRTMKGSLLPDWAKVRSPRDPGGTVSALPFPWHQAHITSCSSHRLVAISPWNPKPTLAVLCLRLCFPTPPRALSWGFPMAPNLGVDSVGEACLTACIHAPWVAISWQNYRTPITLQLKM